MLSACGHGRGKAGQPLDALKETYNAVKKGAIGVDMGRNIFQANAPEKMIAAVKSVIHLNYKPKVAYNMYKSFISPPKK